MIQRWSPARRPMLDQDGGAVIRAVVIARIMILRLDGEATICVDSIAGLHRREEAMIHAG